ncbi:hypothetical protein AAG906_029891 [Vitis piasezkii]|uniref:F-box domain-containing protein n=1 Tax=Vitis vinifera TaxID=29760 RepID=A0ABY9DRC9_VITVI|nr:F-box protein FBW2 [Vitis vinifera]XP_010664341.1 F-box protein FBW2 [Vitis vinifera]XP_010664342.1 F-box protein FBW2 [Vitis vinifera]XP_010664343.1 F-box protein FBW2 [Vitis vinifera]XP_010664344.1 F-box protein FBW2 [Vitis vinifera]WKA09609.1 hypothetical protein VitviT2T_027236 [Vitis vinifera]WKA09610.1 hypothetical protein VitviT2T_027236 [Vitis vinifera]|eukprot:XP_010664340.1 PREDICTED: F-box protein FBW2 [Vitis vinifera]
MEEESDIRRWDELIPDALGLIFRNLSLREILTVIPRVCKSWDEAVKGPYCWQEIDIGEWSDQWPEHLDRMLEILIRRSCGSLRKLCVFGLQNDRLLSFIAEHAGSLQTLQLIRSEISDSLVEEIAGRFSTLTFLDVSCCNKMGSRALEAIGKNCKSLVGLCRNMHPLTTAGKLSQDEEAHAIATTMPKLKHLEMAYHLLSTKSVLEILSCCPELELLDLRGCWHVELNVKFLKEKFPKLRVLGPVVVDYCRYYEMNECDDYSDYDESSDGTWDDEGGLEELEVRFYEGFGEHPEYGWPTSP